MRIKGIKASAVPPVDLFEVDGLSDLVVVAGPNGVGKSRLVGGLLAEFQKPKGTNVRFAIEATSLEERQQWKKSVLDTALPDDRQLLINTLRQNQQRRNFKSSVLYYESNRSIQNLQPLSFAWEFADPWEEHVAWNSTFGGLTNRFQDTIHALFKKIQAQKSSIAAAAIRLKREGHSSMKLEFSDPLEPFKEAFSKLLGPKELENLDPQNQRLRYLHNGEPRETESLSSGEREVLNIAFDFILRMPSDCIVFFDEPELHLHPELTFKLISTLRSVGKRNQFILCSHSPDLISGSLNDSVIFLTPPNAGANQAVLVDPTNETSSLLNNLGHSVGVIALGKKIVLVEGEDNSLDKKTYSQLTRGQFPNLVILPSKGKEQIASFGGAVSKLLTRTIWGVDFFMLCDRDAVPFESEAEKRAQQMSKVELLPRYHLENYFLDAKVITAIFTTMEPDGSWLRDEAQVEKQLRLFAEEALSYATALVVSRQLRLNVGNVDVMPGACMGVTNDALIAKVSAQAKQELQRVDAELDPNKVKQLTEEAYERLKMSIETGTWRTYIPGKQVLNRFCSAAKISTGRYINLYLAETEKDGHTVFADVLGIFKKFSAG